MSVLINDHEAELSTFKPLQANDAGQTKYILLQCNRSLKTADYEELLKHKVQIDEYLGEDTYLASFDKADLAFLNPASGSSLNFIKFVTAFPKDLKIRLELKLDIEINASKGKDNRDLVVGLHKAIKAKGEDVKKEILAKTKCEVNVDTSGVLFVKIEQSAIADLTSIDNIRSIGKRQQLSLQSNLARIIMGETTPNGTENLPPGLDGAGQIVSVADTGFDLGVPDPNNLHPAFQNRVQVVNAVAQANAHLNDYNGHGTHVAGCVAGNGALQDGTKVRGTAPGANLLAQSLLDPAADRVAGKAPALKPSDYANLFDQSTSKGSYVMNWSWGISGFDGYNLDTESLDQYLTSYPAVTLCISAGNEGDDSVPLRKLGKKWCINDVGAAKNAITVGASQTSRRIKNEVADTTGFPGNPDDMARFSSSGRVGKLRPLKPDVVAPGNAILSAASRDPLFQGPGSWRLDDGPVLPADNCYCYCSGTSMACPLVTGCVAVLRQAFVTRYGARVKNLDNKSAYPRSDLFKALIVNGTSDIASGSYQGKPIGSAPNTVQGFGRVSVSNSIIPLLGNASLGGFFDGTVADIGFWQSHPEVGTPAIQPPLINGNQQATYTLSVTLAWIDPPGNTIQNQLSLEVRGATPSPVFGKTNSNAIKVTVPSVVAGAQVRFSVDAERKLKQGEENQKYSLVYAFKLNGA